MSHSTGTLPHTATREAVVTPSPLARIVSFASQPMIAVWLLFVALVPLSRIASSNFPSLDLLESTLVLGLFLVVVSFGQGMVILTGGLDLSLPQVVALGAFLTGFLSNRGWPVAVAVLVALAATAVVGTVNGLLVAYAKFPPFIVTLAAGTVLGSILLGVSQGTPAQPSPAAIADLFSGRHALLGVPTPIWALVVFAAVAYFTQMRSTLGRRAFAVGNSEKASRVAGVRVPTTLVAAYMIAGVTYGIAGVMLLGYSSGADLNIGQQWLLPSITAVVIGGSAIRGGAGSFVGTIGGALLITVINIDISAAGFSEGAKQVLYGAVILIALIAARGAKT